MNSVVSIVPVSGAGWNHSVTLIIGPLQNRLFRTEELARMKKRTLQDSTDGIVLVVWVILVQRVSEDALFIPKALRMKSYPTFLSFQKALPAIANRKMKRSFQTGF